MRPLCIALYAEGPTDYRFLPGVVKRTAEALIRNGPCEEDVEIPDVHVVLPGDAEVSDLALRILNAARAARNFDALVVHMDADSRDTAKARTERFEPALDSVRHQPKPAPAVCAQLLPVIPVRMTEAWLLADRDALLAALGVRGAPDGWCVPDSPQDAESISDPKATLERAVRECRRGRSTDVGRLYEPLSARVSLDRLKALRAYQEFWAELRDALRAQAFLSG